MYYDVSIIGGGPGGYVAAIRGAQLGLKVSLIEQGAVGGTCLNKGCIPTKSMVESVSVLEHVKNSAKFGINVDNYSIDLDEIINRKNLVVSQLRKGVEYLLKKNGVEVIRGRARLISSKQIEIDCGSVGALTIDTNNVILATGSNPVLLNSFGYDGENVLTSDDILEIDKIPGSLLIAGGGVIGCEFACIFNALGTKVTLIDLMDRIIPNEDEEISALLKKNMIKSGIVVKNRVKIKNIRTINEGIIAYLESGETIEAEKALVCVGRYPNSRDLNLESIGIKVGTKGEVTVNDRLSTNIPGIYAIGDITGKALLAHVAAAQGITAIENIAGKDSTIEYDVIPGCVFTRPEVASVGITSQDANKKGIEVRVGRFPFSASGKALVMGETDGIIKIISDKNSYKILGVHIIGPHASDLIAEAAISIKLGATVEELIKTIHAHPTLAECMYEAGESTMGLAIHI